MIMIKCYARFEDGFDEEVPFLIPVSGDNEHIWNDWNEEERKVFIVEAITSMANFGYYNPDGERIDL